ncbi:hypothetical protein EON65_43055, partial [archaeon]
AIKHEGGLVIAQTLPSSLFPSMPKSAIATGDVDHILLPAAMSATILQYVNKILKGENVDAHLTDVGEG